MTVEPFYGARLALIGIAFGYAKSLRTRFHRSLATASFLYFLAQLFGSPVFDVTCGVYYWFFAGLMMLAVRLDRELVRAQLGAPAPAVQPRQRLQPFGRPAVPALPRWSSPTVPRRS